MERRRAGESEQRASKGKRVGISNRFEKMQMKKNGKSSFERFKIRKKKMLTNKNPPILKER